MKYVLAMVTCLLALSSSSCVMESEPEPTNGESTSGESSTDPQVGTAREGLLCNGTVVCVDHVLWCEPRTPTGGKPTVVGSC